tara:strand:- start:779 stop:1174 length:396 start_codon:yes stop_codon:yes gene_type:complete
MHYPTVTFRTQDFLTEEEFNSFKELSKKFYDTKQEIEAKIRQSERYKIFTNALGYNSDRNRIWQGINLVVTFNVPTDYVPTQVSFIDPKTLNQLLNGPLLTDEEKRELLKQQKIFPNDLTIQPEVSPVEES